MLLADFNWIDLSPEQRFWWTAVGIGAILLLLAVLVLARLRWIQHRPFATCVALSVFAHVLLIACICLTRIFDAPPPLPGSETIYVTLSDGEEFVVEEPEPEELLTEPLWSEGEQAEEMPPELVDKLVVPDNLDIPDLVDEPANFGLNLQQVAFFDAELGRILRMNPDRITMGDLHQPLGVGRARVDVRR